MADTVRYGKPSMTNLPPELGARIFKQILSSPVPDREKMRRESARLLNEMVAERDREYASAKNHKCETDW